MLIQQQMSSCSLIFAQTHERFGHAVLFVISSLLVFVVAVFLVVGNLLCCSAQMCKTVHVPSVLSAE